jgi:glycosyltransferase involved in cell wall biosynthesis
MRILALSSWWPEPADNGSRLRIRNLLDSLAREHEVHLVSLSQGPVSEQHRAMLEQNYASVACVQQKAWQPGKWDRLQSLVRSEPASVRGTFNCEFARMVLKRAELFKPDALVAFQLNVAPYALLVPNVPKIFEELEVTMMQEQYRQQSSPKARLRYWLTWYKHRQYVQRLLAEFDGCTVASEAEAQQIRALMSRQIPLAVVPNGAVVDEKPAVTPEANTLIYAGALSFSANLDAMQYFLGEIYPLLRANHPNLLLRITGNNSAEQIAALPNTTQVEFTGYLPDIRSAVAQSWLEIVPLRQGGGTRLKILEALAVGTPVVTTSKGCEGLALEHGTHALIADTPQQFSAACSLLLQQPALRAHLAEQGHRLVRERYDWQQIGHEFSAFVAQIAKQEEAHAYA